MNLVPDPLMELEERVVALAALVEKYRRENFRGQLLRDVLGLLFIACVVVLLTPLVWRGRLAPTVGGLGATVAPKPPTVVPLEETAAVLPQTVGPQYIASPAKAVYHRVHGCGHTAWLKDVKEYQTREQAEAAGYRPCTNCFKETHISSK